jgi:arylformamidase
MKMTFGDLGFDSSKGVSIAMPLDFHGEQANAWNVSRASAIATEAGNLVGDTRRGGSCNFETYTLIPHCNGTHTECVGHITIDRISVSDCLTESLMTAVLVTIHPVAARSTHESLTAKASPEDSVITADSLRTCLSNVSDGDFSAIVVRTSPNDESKLRKTYADDSTPYFTADCIRLMNELGVNHLLCDLPSIDRMNDGGALMNHRIFWGLADDTESTATITSRKTVTELAYIPNGLSDGVYILDLQIPAFVADAAPSRPILFPIEK